MQMITIKGWLSTNMAERSMLFGYEITFKCQQHVSLTVYNRMRATVLSTVPFLDGALLWQHVAFCLLVLFFMALKAECADYWPRRGKCDVVECLQSHG